MRESLNRAVRSLFRHPPGWGRFLTAVRTLGPLSYLRAVSIYHDWERLPPEKLVKLTSRWANPSFGSASH